MGGRHSWRCTELTLSNPSQAPRATPEQSQVALNTSRNVPKPKCFRAAAVPALIGREQEGGGGSLAGTLWYLPTARDVVPKMCPHTRAHAVRQQGPRGGSTEVRKFGARLRGMASPGGSRPTPLRHRKHSRTQVRTREAKSHLGLPGSTDGSA